MALLGLNVSLININISFFIIMIIDKMLKFCSDSFGNLVYCFIFRYIYIIMIVNYLHILLVNHKYEPESASNISIINHLHGQLTALISFSLELSEVRIINICEYVAKGSNLCGLNSTLCSIQIRPLDFNWGKFEIKG